MQRFAFSCAILLGIVGLIVASAVPKDADDCASAADPAECRIRAGSGDLKAGGGGGGGGEGGGGGGGGGGNNGGGGGGGGGGRL